MSERGIDPSVAIPNVLLLAVVAIGTFLDREPLRSIRPDASSDAKNIVVGNTVKARPWEDPLAVRERGAAEPESQSAASVAKDRTLEVIETETRKLMAEDADADQDLTESAKELVSGASGAAEAEAIADTKKRLFEVRRATLASLLESGVDVSQPETTEDDEVTERVKEFTRSGPAELEAIKDSKEVRNAVKAVIEKAKVDRIEADETLKKEAVRLVDTNAPDFAQISKNRDELIGEVTEDLIEVRKATLVELGIQPKNESPKKGIGGATINKPTGLAAVSGEPELLILVLVKSGFEPEAVESRIRTRQGVIAAMANAQYLMENSERLNSVTIVINGEVTSPTGRENALEFMSEDFIPENLAPRVDGFSHSRTLPSKESVTPTSDLRDMLGDKGRYYSRIRVVYIDKEELSPANGMVLVDGNDLSAKKVRTNRKFLSDRWSIVVERLKGKIEEGHGYPRVEVVGPPSSDDLVDLLMIPSPEGGRGEALVVHSPMASIETDILMHKLFGQARNGKMADFGKPPPDDSSWPMTECKPWVTFHPKKSLEDVEEDYKERHRNYTLLEAERGTVAFIHDPRKPNGSNKPHRTHIRRMTLPDDHLATALVEELENRGVDLDDPNSAIAIVSESDSLYGNALSVTFRKAVLKKAGYWTPEDRAELPFGPLIDIRSFSYLRGLDGKTVLSKQLPGSMQRKEEGENGNAQGGDPVRIEALARLIESKQGGDGSALPDWRPEGTQQYDRVRALSNAILVESNGRQPSRMVKKLMWRMFGHSPPEKDVREIPKYVAVGVLGSDPYDKLVILQALRPALPEAHFFTTDLDANLLTRENNPIARNMIVASTFGLQLHRIGQGATLPFRDTYQTAVFHSVLRSIRYYRMHALWRDRVHKLKTEYPASETKASDGGKFHELWPLEADWKPNLYEIGRRGAVVLATPTVSVAENEPEHEIPQNRNERRRLDPLVYAAAFALLPLAFLALLCVSCRDVSKLGLADANQQKILTAMFVIGLAVFVTFAVRSGMETRVAWFVGCVGVVAASGYVSLVFGGAGRIALSFAVTMGFCFLAWLGWRSHSSPGEEPFGMLDGVSAWPSEILRFVGVALGSYYCILAMRDAVRAKNAVARIAQAYGEKYCPRPAEGPEGAACNLVQEMAGFGQPKGRGRCRVFAERPLVLLGLVVTLFLLAAPLFAIYGFPHRPLRGTLTAGIDRANIIGNIFLLYLLTAFAILRNWQCISGLITPLERWVESEDRRVTAGAVEIPLRLIEAYSLRLRRLPLYPCLVIFALVLSRHSAIDNWTMPTSVIFAVIYVIGILATTNSLVNYRALQLRARIRDRLEIGQMLRRTVPKAQADPSVVDSVIEGAFSQTFFGNPVFRAILIPIGGGGLLALVDAIDKLG